VTSPDLSRSIDELPDPVLLVQPDGRVVGANSGTSKLFQLPPQELVGKPLNSLVTNDPGKLVRYLHLCSRNSKGVRGSLQIRLTSEHPIDCETIGAMLYERNDQGRLVWLRLVPHQPANIAFVSHKNKFEMRVENNRVRELNDQRWRAAFENSAIGIMMANFAGRFFAANSAFLNMLGYSESELYQLTFLEITFEEDRKRNMDLMKELVEGKRQHFQIEKRYRRKDGTLVWACTNVALVPGMEAGEPFWFGVVENISRRKRAEQSLRESETRLEAFFENSPNLIFSKDRQGRYLYANKEFARAFHIAEEQIRGKRDEEVFSAEQAAAFQANDRRVIEAGLPMEFEETSVQEDGQHTSIVHKFPLSNAEGDICGIGGIVTDITERKRVEKELLTIKDELMAELTAMTRLHEFSTRLLANRELQPLLEEVLDATIALQNADFGNIQLFNPETQALEIIAQRGFQQDFLKHFRNVRDVGAACGRAMELRERIIIEDVETDSDFAPHREIAASAGFRSVQATPLFSRSGEFLGVLSTHFRRPHRPPLRDLRFTDLYARHAADVIERKRLEAARRQVQWQAEEMRSTQVRQAAVRAEVSVAFGRQQDLKAILRECVETIVLHLDAAFTGIWTLDDLGKMLELQASAGTYIQLDGIHRRIPLNTPKVGLVARERKPLLSNDVLHDPRMNGTAWEKAEGIVGFAGYPLIVGNHTVGVLAMFSRKSISTGTLESLASAADLIAQGIERHFAQNQLRDSVRMLRELTETIPQMLWSANANGGIDYCNQRVLDYTGLSPEQVRGTGWMQAVHQDDLEKIAHAWKSAVTTGEPFQYEFRCLRAADRAHHWCISTALPLRDQKGQIIKWFGSVVDLHDWKEAQQALQCAQAELARISRLTTMGELAASIAHEVNQPLTAVTNNASACLRLLADDNLEPATLRRALEEIVSDGARASAVISRIRAFIKKAPAEMYELDINELIQEVLALTERELSENRVMLERQLTKPPPMVLGDRVQLQQVLLIGVQA